MSSGTIIIIIVVVAIIILAYVLSILARKRNETLLDQLEERKEALFNLPVNDEVEEVKNLHLIGQSQVAFREWNQKWVDLSLNSFADIENQIFEAEGFNQSFRFVKAKSLVESIDSQIQLMEEDIKLIRSAMVDLREQEAKNSGRVRHALDLFESLQQTLKENEADYGETLSDLKVQFLHIESEFSEFVTLNTSGDPIEAAAVLDKTEEHMIALKHIMDRLPALIECVSKELPDLLDDLETGYRKLLDENYQFAEEDKVESRLQAVRSAIKDNMDRIRRFELEQAEGDNEAIKLEIDKLYELFNKEISAHQEVIKLTKVLPAYLKHIAGSHKELNEEVERLSKTYRLSPSKLDQIDSLVSEFETMDEDLQNKIKNLETSELSYSQLLIDFEEAKLRLADMEEDQISLANYLNSQEKSEIRAREHTARYINQLHTLKRYMEKRSLPGIPQHFVDHFFTTSQIIEELAETLEPKYIDVEEVNRCLDIATTSMQDLEDEAYQIIQYASLTEQLLQYSNRYRSNAPHIQQAFDETLQIFEEQLDYERSFNHISNALEGIEPGVTHRFVNSYERTRETIRY